VLDVCLLLMLVNVMYCYCCYRWRCCNGWVSCYWYVTIYIYTIL